MTLNDRAPIGLLKPSVAMRLTTILLAVLCVMPLRASTANGRPTVRIVVAEAMPDSDSHVALDRLQQYGGFTAELILTSSPKIAGSTSGLTIILGTPGDLAELQKQWAAHASAKPDSYLIKSVSAAPSVIIASGIDRRGTLYAVYHLADILRAQTDLSELDIFRSPRIAERYVSFGATTYGRRYYKPEQHFKTLKELPSFGYNGIIIYPGGGTPIARRSSPVTEGERGRLYLDPENTKQWKSWFREIEKYHLDIMMTVPPIVPAGYTRKQIANYYAGGRQPRGYIPALKSHFRKYLELLTEGFPETDRYMFNSTEGATFGRNARFFGRPDPERFSTESYLKNNEQVMKAYFDVLSDFFGSDLDRVCFWTHSFGLTTEGLVRMRQVLFQYPAVTIIEDDFWNNNLWPFDLPAMAYLPEALRAEISTRNPYAMFQIATDGEYYGGGSLPNAYPGSHIRSAHEALDRGARMVIQRLDLHDRTPYGTAFGTTEIVPYAASRQLWEPTPSTPEIWRNWADRRFSPKAAPFVIEALQESRTVLLNGLSCNGIDLLAVGSEFQPRLWKCDDGGITRFYLFSRPGQRLVKKGPGDVVRSEEYTAYQMNTHSIPIEEYRRNQQKARAAVDRALEQIEKARPYLNEQDYRMLHEIFVNGEDVLKAMRLLGELAYATNIVLDNYDRVDNPQKLFEQAKAEIEAYLAQDKLIPEMTGNIKEIIAGYSDVFSKAQSEK